METNFLVSGNHFGPISQMKRPLEAVFPSRGNIFSANHLLRSVATDFLLSGNDILSVIFFETIIAIRGKPIFKKSIYLFLINIYFS